MPSAKVLIAEIDRSSRVPESNGVYGAMVAPFVKGRTDKAGFSTNEDQFLRATTPDGRIEQNMDISYYVALDFLRRSNKLHWVRAHNNALFSGLIIPAEGTSAVPTKLTAGLADPLTYQFKTDELFLLYPTSQGVWGDGVSVKILPDNTNPNSFIIVVFWKGAEVERWPVSRDQTARDGYNQSMYIKNVLEASEYLRVLDNTAIANTTMPKYITSPTTKWNDVATTSAYKAASDAVAKVDQYTISGSNTYAGKYPAAIAGITEAIDAGAGNVRTAEQIALASTIQNADIKDLSATGNKLDLTWKVSAGSVANPSPFFDRTPAEIAGGRIDPAVVGKRASAQIRLITPTYARPELRVDVDGIDAVLYPDEGIQYTAAQLAQAFISLVNSDASLSYTATASDATITLTRKVNGSYSGSIAITENITNVGFAAATPTSFSGGTATSPASASFTITGTFVPAIITVNVGETEMVDSFSPLVTSSTTAAQLAQAIAFSHSMINPNNAMSIRADGDIVIAESKTTGAAGNNFQFSIDTNEPEVTGGSGGVSTSIVKPLGGGVDRVAMTPATVSNTTAIVEVANGRYTVEPQEGMTVAKVYEFTCGPNNTGVDQLVIVEGVEIVISKSITTSAAVASAIAAKSADIVGSNPAIANVAASTDKVVFTYAVNTGMVDAREPRIAHSAALGLDRVYTSQVFSPAVLGARHTETLTVTGAPTADGNILINNIPVAVLRTDSRATVASKIGAILNSQSSYTATVSGEVVTAAFTTNGPKSRISVNVQTTGASIAAVLTQTGRADVPAITKKSRIKFTEGNVYKANIVLNIADVNCAIDSSATDSISIAQMVAETEGWEYHPDVKSIVSTGDEVEIEWTAEAGDHADPKIWTGLSKYVTANPATTRNYSAASEAVPEVQKLQFTSGNTSNLSEIIYVADIPVNITASDDTADKIVNRIISDLQLTQLPDVDSLTVSPSSSSTLVISYKEGAGDVSSLSIEGGDVASAYLGGGSDGAAVTDSSMILALKKTDSLQFNVSLDSGWTSPAFQKELADRAEKRQDHIAILSLPYSVENHSDYINEALDYRKNKLNLNTSHAALFFGHLQITDKYNDRQIWVPPTGAIGALASNTITNYEPWYPFAGNRRGTLSWPTDVKRHLEEGEMDLLYDAQINPILFDPGKGIKLWGQKTLQTRPSATDRINVRLCLIYIKVAMKEYLDDFFWQINDEDTRAELVAGADSFMEGVQARKGVYAFKNICDDTNNSQQDIDNYRLNFHQLLEPTKGIEDIRYYPTLMPTGGIAAQ